MEEKVVLYTIHDSSCDILATRLNQAKIEYVVSDDIHNLVVQGIYHAPVLEVGDVIMDYSAAISWINQKEVDKLCK